MMFKQLYRLQRYTFLHELPNVFNTFLHELSSYAYTFYTNFHSLLADLGEVFRQNQLIKMVQN